jgi:hypothetical protein
MEKRGFNNKHLFVLGYTALSKDKYRIEYTQSIKTFNVVNIFNQSKT